jgi:hypothetical protein
MLFPKQRITNSKAMLLCIVLCVAAIQPVIGQKWRVGYSSFMGVGLQSQKNVSFDNGGFGKQYLTSQSRSLVGLYGIYQPRQWMWMTQLQFTTILQRFESMNSAPGVNVHTQYLYLYPTIQLSLLAAYPFSVGRSMQLSPFFGATIQYLRKTATIGSNSTSNLHSGVEFESNSLSSYGTPSGIQIEPRFGFMFRPNLEHPAWKRVNIMSYVQLGTQPMASGNAVFASMNEQSSGQSKMSLVNWNPVFTQIMLGVGFDIFHFKKK